MSYINIFVLFRIFEIYIKFILRDINLYNITVLQAIKYL